MKKYYTIEQIADCLVVSTRPKIGQQRTILRQWSESGESGYQGVIPPC
jgi:hypothetical protein